MKLITKQRNIIREFETRYLDNQYKIDWNTIKLSRADGYKHNQMVANICVWLCHSNIPFATQCRFRKTSYRPDIICPLGIPKPIIEVRNTETEKRSKAKQIRIPAELHNSIIYVDANQPFKEEMIL
ncbi:MAG: hypothetical protein Q8O88_01000 [bacterium]|nr:hypothetical protein [bacterium]